MITTSGKNRIDTFENYDGGLADDTSFQWSGNSFQFQHTNGNAGAHLPLRYLRPYS